MKTVALLIATLLLGRVASAQEHLDPETGFFAGASVDAYYTDVRQVFAEAYRSSVHLRVVIIASFGPEEVVGLRFGDKGMEAFVMTLSSSIWDLETIRDYEAGRIPSLDKNGKTIPLKKNESYQRLKKRTPSDISKITVQTTAKPLPQPLAEQVSLAERIEAVWKKALFDTRPPKEPHAGNDGITYYFSMAVQNYGNLGGKIWTPDANTKMNALVGLAGEIAAYAQGKATGHDLDAALIPLE